jgi:hypothetical protein
MVAFDVQSRDRLEEFVSALSEAALEVIAGYGINGNSIDLEVRLWQRLQAELSGLSGPPRGLGGSEDRLAVLTRATYEAALEQGFAGSFLELQMSLWSALRAVVREHRPVADLHSRSMHAVRRETSAESSRPGVRLRRTAEQVIRAVAWGEARSEPRVECLK